MFILAIETEQDARRPSRGWCHREREISARNKDSGSWKPSVLYHRTAVNTPMRTRTAHTIHCRKMSRQAAIMWLWLGGVVGHLIVRAGEQANRQ